MKTTLSILICLSVSVAVEARPKSFKNPSEGELGTCSEIGGMWDGECVEDGKIQPAKLQIFQDHCTDIAFFDFDSSIPEVYKTGRSSQILTSKLADSFANFTAYASWSDDRLTFIVNRHFNFDFNYQHEAVRGSGEDTYTVTLKADQLQTSFKGKRSSSAGPAEPIEINCYYRRRPN